MKTIKKEIIWPVCLAFIFAVAISACSNSDNTQATYNITVTNLTNNQPLSPQAYLIHNNGYTVWGTGQQASDGLENLAEAGDPSTLISEANSNASVLAVKQHDTAISPGGSAIVQMESWHFNDLRITIATMLVNTNDAFTGTTGTLIGDLKVNESKTLFVNAYDAGTEANTETAATVPGPAAGGEGLNSALDDTNFVYLHPGVVTADDGLSTSALNESHRWDNPVAKITVTRIS